MGMANSSAAGACRFHMSDDNPNDQIGGGGCACGPRKSPDSCGPYAIFYGSETDDNMSPHLVVCAPCAEAIIAKAHDGELLSADEDELTL